MSQYNIYHKAVIFFKGNVLDLLDQGNPCIVDKHVHRADFLKERNHVALPRNVRFIYL